MGFVMGWPTAPTRQVKVKSQQFSELDIGGRETCFYVLK